MKKFKKMLAGLLGAAMVLTSFGTPAWADTSSGSNLPTITKTTGTLTINKYEGKEGDTTKPLADVGFTVYKVADIAQETTSGTTKFYYKSCVDGLTDADFELMKAENDTESYTKDIQDKILGKLDTIKADTRITKREGTTTLNTSKDKASVKFEDLPIGLYLVEETSAPAQIVNKTANFLVSVPMTNETGDDWIYDVEASPKNAAVYAGINLHKKGTVKKVDGTTTSTALSGVKFLLQRKEGSTWKAYSIGANTTGEYSTDASGDIEITDGLTPGDYRFIELALDSPSDGNSETPNEKNGYILDGTAHEFTVNKEGNIIVGNNQPAKSAIINVDNEKPSLEKTVKKETDTGYDKATNAGEGDKVNWKVAAAVPSNVGSLKVYKLTDTMSKSLTWESQAKSNFTIKATTSNGTEVALAENTDYTLTLPSDGAQTENIKGGAWIIDFTTGGKTKLQNSKVSVITVTFDTLLNENASTGTTGNNNDAQLDYSNAIYPEIDPDNPNKDRIPGEDHIKDQATVYSFVIDVTKIDGNNKLTTLDGVKFDLYKYNGEKNAPELADLKGKDGILVKQNLETADGGKIIQKRLSNGTYYLVETKAMDGYNLLKSPVKVKINVTYTVTTKTDITKNADGEVTGYTSTTTVGRPTFKDGQDTVSGTYAVTIENRRGFTLPKTGDIGTAMFLIIGIGGMLAAVYIMLRGRKRA